MKEEAKILIASNRVAPRGSIFLTDKNNLPYAAALNKEFSFVYAIPQKIGNPEELAKKLQNSVECRGEI